MQDEHEDNSQEAIAVIPGGGQLVRAEIDMQISTAHAFPRSLAKFRTTAMDMATLNEEIAASCFYSVPRGGKTIMGPSARMAEIVAVAWRNLRFGARVVSVDDKMLTAQGVCHDLEANIAITIEIQRRITDSKGKRYNDDMIVVTGNAACSIALRNAVLKVVPKAYWVPIFDQARIVAVGNQKTLVARRTQAIEYFQKMGVSLPQILAVLERKAVEEIGLEDLETLTGLKTAIKDGDTTIEQAFAPAGPSAADKVKEKLNGKQKPKEEPKEPTKESPPPVQTVSAETCAAIPLPGET